MTPMGCQCGVCVIQEQGLVNVAHICCSCHFSAYCFPGAAMVQTENGRLVPMSQLQVGDKIQTGTTARRS